MLEHFFAGAPTLARLRTGLTGPFGDGFADVLGNAGYARGTARGYLRAAAHLGMWMQGEGLGIGCRRSPIGPLSREELRRRQRPVQREAAIIARCRGWGQASVKPEARHQSRPADSAATA